MLRFLEKLHKHKRIGGCVFISPWLSLMNLEPEELEIAHPWINSHINFERIIDHKTNFTCIFSTNDPYVHLDESKSLRKSLVQRLLLKKILGILI